MMRGEWTTTTYPCEDCDGGTATAGSFTSYSDTRDAACFAYTVVPVEWLNLEVYFTPSFPVLDRETERTYPVLSTFAFKRFRTLLLCPMIRAPDNGAQVKGHFDRQ